MPQPNILFLMTDQQRFDTIATLGNTSIYTPTLDRLVQRGVSFTRAYSSCPVCVAARYAIHTGCEPHTTRVFTNSPSRPMPTQASTMIGRCGEYLPQRMSALGYRTFGVGKFHTAPWDEDLGYDVHLRTEELYATPEVRRGDAFASWIAKEHPEFDYIEALMGERTEMYYMPQASALPAELTVESFVADRAIEQLAVSDPRPFFGFVSFIGPHPPFAPPLPFNRMYDPDRMPNPIRGDLQTDHMDEQIPWMNYLIWAEEINDPHARVLKARYYGEISYIDACIGRILDALEASGKAENTLICFFSDHGDHLGDHHAWQKERFFEAAGHIPSLVSYPGVLPANTDCSELVCLADLFGIATTAAGSPDLRQGTDVLGMLQGSAQPRSEYVGMYGEPGTPDFKIMLRVGDWKYIFFANGGREQVFNLKEDPFELRNLASELPEQTRELRQHAAAACDVEGSTDALDAGDLRTFPFQAHPRTRIYQFDNSRGVFGFPKHPADVLATWQESHTIKKG